MGRIGSAVGTLGNYAGGAGTAASTRASSEFVDGVADEAGKHQAAEASEQAISATANNAETTTAGITSSKAASEMNFMRNMSDLENSMMNKAGESVARAVS